MWACEQQAHKHTPTHTMSDEEEESLSEGFSASEEDEWKPGKDARGGESSDDDDSDFEELPPGATPNAPGGSSGRSPAGVSKQKQRQAINQSTPVIHHSTNNKLLLQGTKSSKWH